MGTVLVTGGSGFLGGWCVIQALEAGHQVRTTVRSLSREREVREALASQVDAGDRLSFLAADLGSDGGWAEAVGGCDYVLHVASPFPPAQPKDPDDLIVPARDGTLRVVRAALEAGVQRVVVTSSVAAIRNGGIDLPPVPLTEEHWTEPDNDDLTPYTRSKTYAERAAWDFARESGQEQRLAVVNPVAIIGPVLSDDLSYSVQAIQRLLNGMPGIPRLGFSFVDVRDVADLHMRAMTHPEAGGERFIAATEFLWMSEVGQILRDRLGADAAKVPTRSIPNWVVRTMARFDSGLRTVAGDLGRRTDYSTEKARTRLGWSPRPVEDSIVECARSLIEHGAAPARAA